VIPSEIVQELAELTATNKKGVEFLAEAEIALARAEHLLDTKEAQSFLDSSGSVAERQAKAKLSAADARLDRDLAKAEVNRIRTKLRVIESAIMAQATMSKLMQAEMRL
jgi:rRNA-processing protein FCF1